MKAGMGVGSRMREGHNNKRALDRVYPIVANGQSHFGYNGLRKTERRVSAEGRHCFPTRYSFRGRTRARDLKHKLFRPHTHMASYTARRARNPAPRARGAKPAFSSSCDSHLLFLTSELCLDRSREESNFLRCAIAVNRNFAPRSSLHFISDGRSRLETFSGSILNRCVNSCELMCN